MVNPDLERRYADCVELMDAWKHFLDLVNKAIKSSEGITQQLEEQFLNAKARIAMLHDSFMDSLKHDKGTGQNMIDLVNRSLSLRTLQRANEPEQKKVEIEWHEVFLLLNETVSSLNEERARLADMNQFTHNLGRMRDRLVVNIKGFMKSIWFKLIVATTVFVFVVFGVPALGIYQYDNLRDDAPFMKPVIGGYFDITRDMLGFNMPFIEITTFTDKLRAQFKKVDPNNELTKKEGELPKDQFLNQTLPRVFPYQTAERQELRTLLEKAAAYDVYQFQSKSGTPKGQMYIFWFRKKIDATQSSLKFESIQNVNKKVVDMEQKANVIVFYTATDEGNMEIMRRDYIGPIPPN